MRDILKDYPPNIDIRTFSQDCFDGGTETKESVEMKDKYLKRFYELSHDFVEDCIDKHIESISVVGFFFAWLWPSFVEGQIEANYDYLHDQEGEVKKVYKFEKVNPDIQ